MTINRARTKKQKLSPHESHLNWMGGPAYNINNPIQRLRIAASSCFFGEPQYYHFQGDRPRTQRCSSLSESQLAHLRETLNAVDPQEWRTLEPTQLMEQAIDEALEFDPKKAVCFLPESSRGQG